jgi:hypothetical protein
VSQGETGRQAYGSEHTHRHSQRPEGAGESAGEPRQEGRC